MVKRTLWSRWDWKSTKAKAEAEKVRLRKKGYHVRLIRSKAGGWYIKVPSQEVAELLKVRR